MLYFIYYSPHKFEYASAHIHKVFNTFGVYPTLISLTTLVLLFSISVCVLFCCYIVLQVILAYNSFLCVHFVGLAYIFGRYVIMGLLQLFYVASFPVIKVLLPTALGLFLALDHINILGEDARKKVNYVTPWTLQKETFFSFFSLSI